MMVRESMRVDDLDAEQAFELLRSVPDAQLIDVRRDDERVALGAPSLEEVGKRVIHAVWPASPDLSLDDFIATAERELEDAGAHHDSPVLIVCRSGVRSRAAGEALAARGWTRCLNVAGGFSGRPDLAGWSDRGLPVSHI